MFFSKDSASDVNNNNNEDAPLVTIMHSSIIAILTLIITLYLFDPSILLNSCKLISLSVFTS